MNHELIGARFQVYLGGGGEFLVVDSPAVVHIWKKQKKDGIMRLNQVRLGLLSECALTEESAEDVEELLAAEVGHGHLDLEENATQWINLKQSNAPGLLHFNNPSVIDWRRGEQSITQYETLKEEEEEEEEEDGRLEQVRFHLLLFELAIDWWRMWLRILQRYF